MLYKGSDRLDMVVELSAVLKRKITKHCTLSSATLSSCSLPLKGLFSKVILKSKNLGFHIFKLNSVNVHTKMLILELAVVVNRSIMLYGEGYRIVNISCM